MSVKLIKPFNVTAQNPIQRQDEKLKQTTGLTVKEMCLRILGYEIFGAEARFKSLVRGRACAIVRTSSADVPKHEAGLFADNVQAIVSYLGINVFVTDLYDTKGMFEGIQRGADVTLMANPNKYEALHAASGTLADGDVNVAASLAVIIEEMAGGLEDLDVLILGCNNVGIEMEKELWRRDAKVTLYDDDIEIARSYSAGRLSLLDTWEETSNFQYILDMGDHSRLFVDGNIHDNLVYAAVGSQPDEDSLIRKAATIIESPLLYTTAAMIANAMAGDERSKND